MDHSSQTRIHMCVTTMLCVSTLLGDAAISSAEDWSGWRGPRHDGISRDAKPPIHWSSESNLAWKTATPGIGHSSPVVSGDRVYLTACDMQKDARLVVCYDRGSGKELWCETVARSPIEQMHHKNSPASSTPVTNGKVLVATFAVEGSCFAVGLDHEGGRLWERKLGPFVSKHGYHSCPILHDDTVLLAGLQDSEDSFLVRFDIYSGEPIWSTSTETAIRSFSPPHITEHQGKDIAVVSGANCTTAFDLRNGHQLWRLKGPAEKTVSSIVEHGHLLFVAGGREKKLLAIDLSSDDPTVPRWTSTAGVPYVSSPIIAGGALHQVSDHGIYTRVDLASGKTLQRHRLLGPTSASPIWADDKLYMTDESGFCISRGED